MKYPLLFALLVAGAAPALGQQQVSDREVALGKQLSREILSRSTRLHDPDLERYTEGVVERLNAAAPAKGIAWKVELVRDVNGGSTEEPVSLPGGWLIVGAPLLVAARSEDEFAGMLAHSMEHVIAGHGAKQVQRGASGTNLSTIPLTFLGGWTGAGDEMLVPAGFRAEFRKRELESDQAAARRMSAAGYDSSALASYLDRTQKKPSAQSVLPPKEQRIAALKAAPSPATPVAPVGDFGAMQARVRELVGADFVNQPRKPTLRRP